MYPLPKILSENEKHEIEKKLYEQFGIKEINGMIVQIGKERLFLFQGNLSKEQLMTLFKEIPIERVGIYFAKQEEDSNDFRLSIEGSTILKDQITKNTFEMDASQVESWMKGNELNVETGKKCYLIMTHNGEFFGTGKASALKISNFIPKSRRLRERN